MPIFDYKCRKCGAKFEKIVKSADEQVVCEECGGKAVTRLLGGFAVGRKGCAHEDVCGGAGGHVCGEGCCHHH